MGLMAESDDDLITDPIGLSWRERLAQLPRLRWSAPEWSLPQLSIPALTPPSRSVVVGAAAFAGVVAVVAAFSVAGLKQASRPTSGDGSMTAEVQSSSDGTAPAERPATPKAQLQPEGTGSRFEVFLLDSDQPTDVQLQGLLQAWLDRKADVLAGGALQSSRLADVARSGLLDQVQAERKRDAARATTQVVKAKITRVKVVSSAVNRIELRAQVAYSDERLDANGKVVDRTAAGTLPITYVLGRDGDQWRLEAYWRTKG